MAKTFYDTFCSLKTATKALPFLLHTQNKQNKVDANEAEIIINNN